MALQKITFRLRTVSKLPRSSFQQRNGVFLTSTAERAVIQVRKCKQIWSVFLDKLSCIGTLEVQFCAPPMSQAR